MRSLVAKISKSFFCCGATGLLPFGSGLLANAQSGASLGSTCARDWVRSRGLHKG